MHLLWHVGWPALSILSSGPGIRDLRRRVDRIRGYQDENGAWPIGTLFSILNLMALVKAGVPAGDPAVRRGHASLLRSLYRDEHGRLSLLAWRSEVADTGYGLDSCLRAGAAESWEPAVHFLLEAQGRGGGFAWGSSLRDPDSDATAHVLRAFPAACRRAPGDLRARLEASLESGVKFMLARQNRDGGFSCWRRTAVPGRQGPLPVWHQFLFDVSTADVTARVVEALALAGYDTRQPPIRRALGFLVNTQSGNGGWWSRWWPGYLVGAGFALRAFGALGLGDPPASGCDPLLRRCRGASERAIQFILRRQNADGGWGETARSDVDVRAAGQGASTPVYTAHVAGALLRAGFPATGPAVRRAMEYLLRTMSPAGDWKDRPAATIFASSHYFTYDFLARVIPLDALSDFLAVDPQPGDSPGDSRCRPG